MDKISRKRFLGLLGATAAFGSACSRPQRGGVVPAARRPAGSVPGVPDRYASVFCEAGRAHPVLVVTREGRPIHIEGNDLHPDARGKAPLRAIADILGLYDPERLREPLLAGRRTDPATADAAARAAFDAARKTGKPILLMSDDSPSPTRRALIAGLAKAAPIEWTAWEPAPSQAARLSLAKALSIVCFEADILSGETPSWVGDFAAGRGGGQGAAVLGAKSSSSREGGGGQGAALSRLYSFESGVSLTGSKADHRLPLKPSRAAAMAFALCRALHEKGLPLPAGMRSSALAHFDLRTLAEENGLSHPLLLALAADLAAGRGSAAAVCGPALPPEAHRAVSLLNAMLGAEGTFTWERPPSPGFGLAAAALEKAASGGFSAAVFWGGNPAYAFPDQGLWKRALAAIPFKARIGLYADETALDSDAALPESHWLESWGDFESESGLLSLRQPAIGPLYDTLQGEDMLLRWFGRPEAAVSEARQVSAREGGVAHGGIVPGARPSSSREGGVAHGGIVPGARPPSSREGGGGQGAAADYRHFLKERWRKEVSPAAGAEDFEAFWNSCLHDGFLRGARPDKAALRRDWEGAARSAASGGGERPNNDEEFELVLKSGAGVFDGRYGNNGWLQETPEPVTKQTWGNALLIGPQDAERLGLRDGQKVRVEAGGGRSAQLPALIVPGQARGTLCAALGYGRRFGSVARGVGQNLFPLIDARSAAPFLIARAALKPAQGSTELAITQGHFRMEGRDIARSFPVREFREGGAKKEAALPTMYPEQSFPEHKWGMAVDLSLCVGCSACVVACQSENNIPSVGEERVRQGREMHWIRVDRYLTGSPEEARAVSQPMLCQQCDNAPCETVCPVNATNHSPEGLNQMVYNRCVGTRYCANNCPYKVRRFNFFEYNAKKEEPETLAFNPEVSVRPRGVMEKCTFCVERIQDAKQRAKLRGRPLRDGEVLPACAVACPASAIVFGDLKDSSSRVSALSRDPRGYRVLEELGARPSVTYLAELTNPAALGPPSPERGRPPLAKGALPMGASSPERGRSPLAKGAGDD